MGQRGSTWVNVGQRGSTWVDPRGQYGSMWVNAAQPVPASVNKSMSVNTSVNTSSLSARDDTLKKSIEIKERRTTKVNQSHLKQRHM